MKRTLIVLASALTIGALASSCSSVDPNAAVVNGHELKRVDFEDELRSYARNDAFVAALTAQGQTVRGSFGDSVTAGFASDILRQDIALELVRQEFEAEGLRTDASLTAVATPQVTNLLGGAEGYAKAPTKVKNDLLRGLEQVLALRLALSKVRSLDDASLKEWFAQHGDHFVERCFSQIVTADEQAATALAAKLAAGEDFAALAKTDSLDTATGPSGGQVRNSDGSCLTTTQIASATASDAVAAVQAAKVGTPTAPILDANGNATIYLVTSEKPLDFATAKASIAQDILASTSTAFTTWLNQATEKAKITIDPRYGTWDGRQIVGPDASRIDEANVLTGTATTAAP